MAASSRLNRSETDSVTERIVLDLIVLALNNARKSAEQLLQSSAVFLTSEAHDGLKSFHDLYFKESADLDARKTDANRSVDDLIDQLQSGQVASESEGATRNRLGISGLQKRLEAVISLESNVRENLAPIISGMRFEDTTRQRLGQLAAGFSALVSILGPDFDSLCGQVAAEIAGTLSSKDEKEQYYEHVLHESPPSVAEEESVWVWFT